MEKMRDPRIKRTDLNQLPCLQDPTLQCVSNCQVFSYEKRDQALAEVNLDLPPWTETHSMRITGEGGNGMDEQHEREETYHEVKSQMLGNYCTVAAVLGVVDYIKIE